MAGRLSTELLKVHNAHTKDTRRKRRDKLGGFSKQSDGSSMMSFNTKKDRFLRLRGKLRYAGMAFSKSGSEIPTISVTENTYKLSPDDTLTFSPCKAKEIIVDVLKSNLSGKNYNSSEVPALCRTLSDIIKEKIKSSGVQRYKLVCYVLIMENRGQSIRHASRCLWDTSFDSFATESYEDKSFCAVGSVYATYFT